MTPDELSKALGGDRKQVRGLIRKLTVPIQTEVGYALQRRGIRRGRDPRQEVEDMVHEVFVRLLADDGKLLRAWDPQRGRSLSSYVRMIARTQMATIMRSGRRNPWTEDPTDAATMEQLGSPREDLLRRFESAEALDQLLAQLEDHLDERGMMLFRMLWLEECSIEEVTDVTGIGRNAIYAWRFRVRKLVAKLGAREAA